MAILSDCHLHTSHSGDSDTPMESMILEGISKGLHTMCFTEHNDFEYPVTEMDPEGKFECNIDSYLYDLIRMREKYAGQISVEELSGRLLVHEYGHTIQSLILGPLYLLIIGIPSSLWGFLGGRKRREQQIPYCAFFTEKWANRLGEWVTGEESIGNLVLE